MTPTTIRAAREEDLPAINDIYNYYVDRSTTTYDYEPWSIGQRRKWFAGREDIHPVTVAVRDQIVGWGALGWFRVRAGYRWTVENSVYVHHEHLRTGVGAAILQDQVERAQRLGLHAIIAGIDAEQHGSVELHRRFGFQQVAKFEEVGYKLDRWLDVIFMQLLLPSHHPNGRPPC